jgi:hypothetical protein
MSWDDGSEPLAAQVLTTQELTFFPPSSIFHREPADPPLRSVNLTLNIPYEKGKIFKSIKPGEFRLTVTLLPAPVKSLVLHDVRNKTDDPPLPPKQEQSFVQPNGGELHVYSYDCADKDEMLGPYHPHQGWKIDPGTIKINKGYTRGDQRSSVQLVDSTENSVSVRIRTWANCFLGISDGSGNVYVSLEYTEWYQPPKPKPTTTESEITTNLSALTWGGSVIQGVTEGRWRLDAVLFDGTVRSYNSTDVTNPYLKVEYKQGSGTVNISAVTTDSLTVKP